VFKNSTDKEMETLKKAWKVTGKKAKKIAKKLEDSCWYDAKIDSIEAEMKNGKPRVQMTFDVEGNRLVKDFWLTCKGIFVFKKFLKKLGVEVDCPQEINEFELFDKNCEVLVSEKVFQDTTWVEIENLRSKG